MSTPEQDAIEYGRQYSAPSPVRAPDIERHTALARGADVQNRKNSIEARTNPHAKNFSRIIGIGTRATYGTLPANAGKLNESQPWIWYKPDALPTIELLRYVVPAGRVLYITSYKIFVTGSTPVTGGPGLTNVIPGEVFPISIFVDGSADPWNQNIATEPLGSENPVHIIAGGGQTVRITGTLIYPSAAFDTVYGRALIRGDMLIGNHNAVPYTALMRDKGNTHHE